MLKINPILHPGVIDPERACGLDFKDAAPRLGHSNVVFDLFIETCFLHLIIPLSNFSELFSF